MKMLTIFTPTYNRAHTLERLYLSFCAQTCQNFVWLVIDDGSTAVLSCGISTERC
jgi:glycosyltransferase involved in cell wall biosynthesis